MLFIAFFTYDLIHNALESLQFQAYIHESYGEVIALEISDAKILLKCNLVTFIISINLNSNDKSIGKHAS